jgi:hypothetical protein
MLVSGHGAVLLLLLLLLQPEFSLHQSFHGFH